MKPALVSAIALVFATFAGADALAAASDTTKAYQAAQQTCESARLQKLEPLRRQKVAQCVRSGKSQQHCKTFYSTYGNNSNNVNGSVVRGRFYDLPACRAAARAARRLNGPQNF